MTRLAAVLAGVLLGCGTPVRTPAPRQGFTSYEEALPVLCAAYAKEGLPCAETLVFDHSRAPDDVLSSIDVEFHSLRMQPIPGAGQGAAYWRNWSVILSGGTWKPTFATDRDAREVAAALLVGVLAHELGHHLAEDHGCNQPGLAGELLADELSVDLVRTLVPRHDEMRAIADAMIAAVPGYEPIPADLDGWARSTELPAETAIYAAVHLDRQRRVLADPTRGPRAREACRRRHAERLAQRIAIPTRVETRHRIERRTAIAFDRAGRVWRMPDLVENELPLFFEDEPAPRVVVPLPGAGELLISELAVIDAQRFAIHTRTRTWLVDHGAATELTTPTSIRLAFDETGTLYQGVRAGGSFVVSPIGGAPRWRLPLSTSNAHWGDGPLSSADGFPGPFAVHAGGVVFFDLLLHAVRKIDGDRVVTLAGSLPGHLDGPGDRARLFHARAFGVDARGDVHVVGWNQQERVISALRDLDP